MSSVQVNLENGGRLVVDDGPMGVLLTYDRGPAAANCYLHPGSLASLLDELVAAANRKGWVVLWPIEKPIPRGFAVGYKDGP